jgi:hypothetical protein
LSRHEDRIGLPNPVPGVPGTRLVEWARHAEERGFASLATIDRIADGALRPEDGVREAIRRSRRRASPS